jgi:NAD(P)H-flavin reductase
MKIIINNNVYDITTFIQEHPGGPEVFKLDEKNGSKNEFVDFTHKFNDVGHSEYAVNLLENYKVDELSEDDPRFNGSNKLEYNKTKILKLVTHEDKFHVHKIFGIVSLLNYFYLLFDFFYSGARAEITLRNIDSSFIGLTWVHSSLSLSALQFLIPRTRTGIIPMIWQEFRAHSIVFAVRSFVLINLLYFITKYCNVGDTIIGCVRIGVVLLAMKLADLSTEYLRENKKETTTATMPYWSDCPANVQSAIKYFYTHSQFMATIVCLFGKIPYILAVAFPIQFASFMMTLVRKNIISSFWYHMLYGGSLLAVYLINAADIRLYLVIFVGIVLVYIRVNIKLNKYVMWTIVGIIGLLIDGGGAADISVLLLFILCMSMNMNLECWSNYVFDDKQYREESNHRVVMNVVVTDRNHMITIQLCEGFPKYKPGMYFNLYFDTKKRPYTPIEFNHTHNIIKFLIKRMEGGEVSPLICDKYLANNTIFIKGPFGRKYYDPAIKSFICDDNVISAKHIVMCSCGSGITPLYSMGVAWMNDNIQNQRLHFMSSYARVDDAILRTKNMLHGTEKLFISQENNKLTPSVLIEYINDLNNDGNVVVFTCGTIKYNQMINDCCTITNVKCYEW